MISSDRLYKWFNLRPGEERSASLMLLHSFFMGTSTVFFETAASAFFLAQFDAAALPFVYLAAAAVSISTGLTYTRLKDRVAFAPLMTGTLGMLFVLVCLMRFGLSFFEAGWLIFSMMVAYRLISILTDLEFWAVAARLYDVQQSKRLFSLIGSGEVTARILGAFSVPLLVAWLGVANLLWISAAGLLLCALILVVIVGRFPEVRSHGGETGFRGEAARQTQKHSIRPIWGNRYLKLVFLLAFFAVLGKYFVDFAFLTQMQTRWQEVESLASFFGLFSGVTQVINLLIRVFVSSRLLHRFGVGVGLVVLFPIAHFICTIAIIAVASAPAAVFWLIIMNQGIYKTLKHPVDNPSFKILYQPLPRRERLAAQIVVEAIVTPLAIGLAALFMIVVSELGTSTSALTYLMILNFAIWAIVATVAFREYGTALIRALEKRSLDRASFSIEDENSVKLIRSKLTSEYPEDVIFALDLLQRVDSESLEESWRDLLTHPSDEVRRYVLLQIESHRPESLAVAVGRLVSDESDPVVKAVGLRALAALGDPMNQVASYLHDPDRVVERGALIGLLPARERSDAAGKAQRRLEELAISSDPEDRLLTCKVLGDTVRHETSSILLSLLEDHDRRVRRAEILEVNLPQEVKELTLPLIEDLEPAARLERLVRRFPQRARHGTELIRDVLSGSDRRMRLWTKACAIYGAAMSPTSNGFNDDLVRLCKDPNPLLAKTSRWALGADGQDRSRGMLTIEKIILLKGVGMFSATSEDILADVATILEEVELSQGEVVFEKGEQGDSMYIIIHGRVRIFDGEKTINFLGEREIFGELALLDPEPRSASVETVEETRLFRLDRGTLFELMADNVGVVSGIMHVLCSRLRRMTAIATGR